LIRNYYEINKVYSKRSSTKLNQ